MKKKIILILITFSNLICFSQNEHKILFGLKFSIDNNLSSKYLTTDGNINGYSNIVYNEFNFTSGIIAEYSVSSKLNILSGILYSKKDFIGTYNCATCDIIYPFPGYSPELIKQRFLEIPILLKYFLINDRFNLSFVSGLNNGFVVENDLKNNRYVLNGVIGLEIGYEFIEKWNIQLGTDYRKSLTHFYNDKNYNFKLNGLYFKILHKLE
ncbi:hypothetical protein [Lutibacter sp.]|uniref:hypothetical protein n=1 Tax=Lutibacter sp. TaxID=1925666 RepID=UPI0025BA7CE5|nr:hypothetical protein [Lutibacter sp.]MCF6169060.1 porin family protein [Lutibacter sp.]